MSYLSLQEAQALSANDISKTAYAQNLQKKLLTRHLMFFAARFARALQMHGRSGFYQTIGRILGCLSGDGEIFPGPLPGDAASVRDDTPFYCL